MTGGLQRRSGVLSAIRLLFVGDAATGAAVDGWLGTADDIDVLRESAAADAAGRMANGRVDCLLVADTLSEGDWVAFHQQARDHDSVPPVLVLVTDDDTTAGSAATLVGEDAADIVRERFIDDSGEPLVTRIRNVVARRRAEAGETATEGPSGGSEAGAGQIRALFDNAAESIVYVEHEDGPRIRDVNPAFEETFGVEREAVIGEDIDDVVATSERRAAARGLSNRVRDGDLFETEVTRETANGTREFLLRLIPVDQDTGAVERVFAVYFDLTERKRRERALERTNERISRLHEVAHRLQSAESEAAVYQETVTAAIDILEFDWCVTSRPVDGRFELTAASEASPFEVGDTLLAVDEGVAGRVYRSGESDLTNDVLADADGSPADDAIRSALTIPIGDDALFQAVSSEVGTFDETDRELAELLVTHTREALSRIRRAAELERLNERVSQLHEAAHRLQSAESETAVYRETVAAATDILEFDWCVTSRPVDGRLELTAASDASPFEVGDAPLAVDEGTSGRALATGESDLTDDMLEDSEGEPAVEALRSGLTVPIGEFGIFQAVSSEVAAFDENDRELAELLVAHTESALQWLERTAELERQNDRLEQFASAVSHDLRNPLNVAQGRVSIALETGEISHLNDARDALERMNTIIDDVLALARGEPTVEPVPVDIESVVRTAWSMVDTGDASLVVDVTGQRLADPGRLQRLLENLFRNSIEHGNAGTVRIEKLADGIAVIDDGTGFTDADAAFESGQSTGNGTGLGLAIVRRIADAHGWTVGAENGETGARIELRGVEEPAA
ncbi:MAG: GAF domain-containing protein [Halolamina sp.]